MANETRTLAIARFGDVRVYDDAAKAFQNGEEPITHQLLDRIDAKTATSPRNVTLQYYLTREGSNLRMPEDVVRVKDVVRRTYGSAIEQLATSEAAKGALERNGGAYVVAASFQDVLSDSAFSAVMNVPERNVFFQVAGVDPTNIPRGMYNDVMGILNVPAIIVPAKARGHSNYNR